MMGASDRVTVVVGEGDREQSFETTWTTLVSASELFRRMREELGSNAKIARLPAFDPIEFYHVLELLRDWRYPFPYDCFGVESLDKYGIRASISPSGEDPKPRSNISAPTVEDARTLAKRQESWVASATRVGVRRAAEAFDPAHQMLSSQVWDRQRCRWRIRFKRSCSGPPCTLLHSSRKVFELVPTSSKRDTKTGDWIFGWEGLESFYETVDRRTLVRGHERLKFLERLEVEMDSPETTAAAVALATNRDEILQCEPLSRSNPLVPLPVGREFGPEFVLKAFLRVRPWKPSVAPPSVRLWAYAQIRRCPDSTWVLATEFQFAANSSAMDQDRSQTDVDLERDPSVMRGPSV